MNNIINIGIPSKGRLRKDVLKTFNKKRLKLVSERGERDLIGSIKSKNNIKILFIIGVVVALYAVARNLDIIKIILIYWKDLILRK